MTKKTERMQSWQVFRAARKQLGPELLGKIFHRGVRSAYDWGQDPACTEVRCRNPLDLMHALFERLDEQGRGYVARAAIAYLESALDDEAEAVDVPEPHPSLDVELLRDFAAVSRLQAAVETGEDVHLVRAIAAEAKDEIERTVARYMQDVSNHRKMGRP